MCDILGKSLSDFGIKTKGRGWNRNTFLRYEKYPSGVIGELPRHFDHELKLRVWVALKKISVHHVGR